MGAGNVRLETESAVDTMDFVNKIVNHGKQPQGELRSKSSLPLQKENENFADKLNLSQFDFNFPVIPPYEGIQQNIMNLESKQSVAPIRPPLPNKSSAGEGYPKASAVLQQSPYNHTLTSLGSLNSLNLDRLNQKNEDRIAKLGAAFDSLDLTQRSTLTNNYYTSSDRKENSSSNKPTQIIAGGGHGATLLNQNDDLKQVDSLLFDLLRSNEQQRVPSSQS